MRVLLAMLLVIPGMALAGDVQAEKPCRLAPFKAKESSAELLDCPADVQPLIDRVLGCQHWVGEEPSTLARAHEIETAMAELKCDRLSLEYDAMLKKYAKRPDVRSALEAADLEYSLEF